VNKFNFEGFTKIKYEFNIEPIAAPRMTQRDKWAKRKCVTKYFGFRNKFLLQANVKGFDLPDVLNILFIISMPKSWSKKKKNMMCHTPHKSRPDRDNYLKAVQDSFNKDDGYVWDGRTIKIWGYTGKIIIF